MALTILSLLSLLALSQARIIEPLFDSRIVNGVDAKFGEIPYQISLQDKHSNFHFCGGSILDENHVITAAHCIAGKSPNNIKVVAGTIDLQDPKSTHEVIRITAHEKYNAANSWINDIAILRVGNPFVKSTQVGYVTLPPKGHVVKGNDLAVVSGWGRLWQNGPTTKKLQRVNILIADQDYCRQKYNSMGYNVHLSQVCAYDPDTEKGSCNGDSGGPLTVGGKLVGLVSWAYGCASTNYPTVYTRVESHLDWINAHLD
ncbi:trypsin-1 [Harpegnathos saltator]|uniref:trypsin-1 n=1 Tax=Harpegnathos saltator TaxID=610380 RepID=UPI000DBEDE12|nr:trypsin-1 [Harpegnathos saltator]